MPPWVLPLYSTALLGAFLCFGWMVRSNRLEGKAILWVGTGIGLAATIASYLLLRRVANGPLPIQAILFNAIAMAACTGFVVGSAYRQQRIDDLAEWTVGATRMVVRQCSAFRIRDLDALIVPSSTSLVALGGPATTVLTAAGGAVERAARGLSPVKPDKVVSTPGGNLGVGTLFHVAVHDPMKAVEANRLKRGVETAAQQARKAGARRLGIALSPLRGLAQDAAAEAVTAALVRHADHFQEVVFVGLDPRTALALQKAAAPAPATEGAS